MPELPEVETIVRDLKAQGLAGSVIQEARVYWNRSIASPAVGDFLTQIKGKEIVAVTRRGKYIVLELKNGGSVTIHLRMTGRLSFANPGKKRDTHEHVILSLEGGRELRFRDMRKFGKWTLSENGSAALAKLGPEPLDPAFTLEVFLKKIAERDRMLKPLLLDQTFIAGLGNIYVDEALWEAKLHSVRTSGSLTRKEISRLYEAILKVLRTGIENLGTTLGKTDVNFYSVSGRRGRNQDALKVFRRTGDPCPRCHTPIKRLIVAQRSTHICPRCQRKRTS